MSQARESRFVDRFLYQMERSAARYESRILERESSLAEVELIRSGKGDQADAGLIDDPVRIARRFAELASQLPEPELRKTLSTGSSNSAFVERIIDKNELMSAGFLIQGAKRCRSVGRIVVRSASNSVLAHGTGFLISPRLLITNNHVLGDSDEASHSVVQFDYVEIEPGKSLKVSEFRLLPSTFFETDVDLDYTVVAVEPSNAHESDVGQRGWSPLIAPSGKLIVAEPVNIIQHPGAQVQQISIRQNEIVDVVGDFLHYSADTMQGSSGALVANDQWQVGALHHAGVPKRDGDDILLIGGARWDRTAATAHRIHWVANEGTRISRIVESLNQKVTDAARLGMLRQSFQTPPDVEESSSVSPVGDARQPGVRLDQNRATFTIPLELTVGVPGMGTLGDGSPRPPVDVPPPVPQKVGVRQHDPAAAAVTSPQMTASLDRALATLRRTEAGVYYDEAADTVAINDYYDGIAEDGDLVGADLFHALAKRVTETHHNELSYREARLEHLYPNVDLREDLELQSIYSGSSMSPSEVIRNEVDKEMRIERKISERFDVGSLGMQEYELLVEALESSAGFNCEHIVCQSWFGKRQPMKADMHHLFACEPGCNSFRSNIPYFQFGPADEARRERCGRRENGVGGEAAKFEPVAGKGPAARATLFFLLRYPGEIGDEARELQKDRLGVLLDWHHEFEVGRYEKHRNAEIFKIQGNRNPLIDFPEWAEHIEFELGF